MMGSERNARAFEARICWKLREVVAAIGQAGSEEGGGVQKDPHRRVHVCRFWNEAAGKQSVFRIGSAVFVKVAIYFRSLFFGHESRE